MKGIPIRQLLDLITFVHWSSLVYSQALYLQFHPDMVSQRVLISIDMNSYYRTIQIDWIVGLNVNVLRSGDFRSPAIIVVRISAAYVLEV